MDQSIRDLFTQVERYVVQIVSNESEAALSKEENRVLALQLIHRLNQKIGMLGRSDAEMADKMKTLQIYINSITIGLKNDNIPQIRFGFYRARNLIVSLS